MSIYLLKPVCLRCAELCTPAAVPALYAFTWGKLDTYIWICTAAILEGRDLSGQPGGTQGTSARLAGPGQLLVKPGVLSLYPGLPYFLYEYSIACLLRLYVRKDRQSVE
ncbi:hypothetical protein Bbelb_403530 [Branchiostoma belcheri]|nr:hypothetical protein Bbelb_403530 [Branchiostoma belcheri]